MRLTAGQREALKLAAAGKFFPALVREDDGWHARWIAPPGVADTWTDAVVRSFAVTALYEDAEEATYRTLHDAWLAALQSRTGLVRWDDAECAAFAEELRAWRGEDDADARASLCFTFAAPEGRRRTEGEAAPEGRRRTEGEAAREGRRRTEGEAAPEGRRRTEGEASPEGRRRTETRRARASRAQFEISVPVPRGARALKALGEAVYVVGTLRGLRRVDAESFPRQNKDGETSSDAERLRVYGDANEFRVYGDANELRVYGDANELRVYGDVTARRVNQDYLAVPLDRGEAEDFLQTGARELRDAGYRVEGVDLAASVEAAAELTAEDAKADAPTGTARAKFEIRVAGQVVTTAEIRFLLEQGSSLVFFRDHWIEVDRGLLREALRALERLEGEKLSPVAALRFATGLGAVGRLEIAGLAAGGWVKGLLARMRARGETVLPDELGLDERLFSTLRTYQRRGVKWLRFMTDHGFGALLADDMGLGKTVQTIAWTLSDRAAHPEGGPVLIVAPLTLLTNWQREFARFAPALKVYVHHGESRHVASGFLHAALSADVVITGYSLLVRDYDSLSEVPWRGLVLDEAQAIKNPDTKVAAAVRSLLPPKRLALTGTPVENSVADLWSIEEFLNPGLLGDRKGFVDRFVQPLACDPRAAAGARLKAALEPFVLRRLKGETDVASELAPKTVIREWCRLAPADRAAYESTLADFRSGEHRPGDVFALLTGLKLACDGDGKRERLFEILDGVLSSGEAALVFTQYAKVGALLKDELRARYGFPVQFLHGALSVRQREAEIAAFNARAGRIFVLSLKAGGFGLNLTKATHVVHFDRWWNPAVEDQATDRAHRIGQTKPVFVHALVTTGTVEERVDRILRRKSAVADTLVASGESFLLKLAPDELESVVRLEDEP